MTSEKLVEEGLQKKVVVEDECANDNKTKWDSFSTMDSRIFILFQYTYCIRKTRQ